MGLGFRVGDFRVSRSQGVAASRSRACRDHHAPLSRGPLLGQSEGQEGVSLCPPTTWTRALKEPFDGEVDPGESYPKP